jgi:hypothetical protein
MASRFAGPRFFYLVFLLTAALAGAVALTLTSLKQIAVAPVIDVAVPASAIAVDGELVRGGLSGGLPAYRLHWDGQPPSALLVDRRSGAVLAASVFSDETFARSRDAVRFTPAGARFVLDARRWTPGTPLVLRCEAVPSRARYYGAATASIALLVSLFIVFAWRRWSQSQPADRPAWLRGAAESALFLLIAAGTFAAIYPGAPVRVSDISDEANLNSFAAALEHPERFTRDAMLSDPANFAWYIPMYISVIRAAGRLGFHYDTAQAFLAAGIAALLLFGLRRLFYTVARDRSFALAATLTLALMYEENLPAGESWGLLGALPRALFTACVPWVLLLAIRCAPSPRRWWIALAAAGLLMQLYPLSAPALVVALLFAFVVASDEPMAARMKGAALAMIAAAATMLPYVIVYTLRYQRTVDADADVAAQAIQVVRNTSIQLEVPRVLQSLVMFRVQSLRILLDGLALVLLLRQRHDRTRRFYLGLALGFLLIVFVVPSIDGVIAAHFGRRPYETELVRNVRFLDLFLVGALALAVRERWPAGRSGRALVAAGAVCAVLTFGPGWATTAHAMAGRARLSWRIQHGQPDAATRAAQEAVRAIQALRQAGERVAGPVGLRQFDVPTGWVTKDAILLTSAPSRALLTCVDVLDRARPLLARPVTERSLFELSSMFDAQLFFLRPAEVDDALAHSQRVIFQNDVWTIVSARPRP